MQTWTTGFKFSHMHHLIVMLAGVIYICENTTHASYINQCANEEDSRCYSTNRKDLDWPGNYWLHTIQLSITVFYEPILWSCLPYIAMFQEETIPQLPPIVHTREDSFKELPERTTVVQLDILNIGDVFVSLNFCRLPK